MTIEAIIHNWIKYDNRKLEHRENTFQFNSTRTWEVDYFSEQIKNVYPFIPDSTIRQAIRNCARSLSVPCRREEIAESVLRSLSIPL